MHKSTFPCLLALAAALAATAPGVQAQEAGPAPAETPPEDGDRDSIVVLGSRIAAQIDAPQPPLLELDSGDVAAYGVGSIGELLEVLGPQVTGARGRGSGSPVVLVNGVRVSSFRTIRSYPPEAIEKVEVFTEEVAVQFGYPPDQRVINFILVENFSSREIEVEYGQPFRGGTSTREAEATYLRLSGPARLNINLEWQDRTPLTENERGIIQSDAAAATEATDAARFRSLIADSRQLEATANWTTALREGESLTLNATFERDESLRLQGLDTFRITGTGGNPLTSDRRADTYALAGALNLDLGLWRLDATVDAQHADTINVIERRNDTGIDRAESSTDTLDSLLTANGIAFTLPAGDVSVTIDGGFKWNRIESEDTRNRGIPVSLGRERYSAGLNVTVPLTSEEERFGGALGDLTLNLSGGIDELSDFGTLSDWTTGLTWGLTDNLSLSATYIARDAAPSLTQLGAPEIATPNVQVFDFVRGDTVLATVIDGGNPDLVAERQRDWKLGLIWQVPIADRATFSVEYVDNHSEDVSREFPLLTPAIEAAFPARVTRGGDGRLVEIDNRPVTFAAQDARRLQFGLDLSGRIGSREERGSARADRPTARSASDGRGAAGGQVADIAADSGMSPGVRAQFCEAEPEALRERLRAALEASPPGEHVTGEPGGDAPLSIPPHLLERLTAQDGTIDAEALARLRRRICGAPGASAGTSGGAGDQDPQRRSGRGTAGRFGRGGDDGPSGRWFVDLQYRLELDNTVRIAPGVPILDLLDGDALSGGGVARHEVDLRSGVYYDGLGVFLTGSFTGPSRVDGGGLPGSTDLFFKPFTRFGINTFADLGRREDLVEAMPFLEGVRVGFDVENLFDTRRRVADANGVTPLRYQPFLLDPEGRLFELELRKLF